MELVQPISGGEGADAVVAHQFSLSHGGEDQVITLGGRQADLFRQDRPIDSAGRALDEKSRSVAPGGGCADNQESAGRLR